MTLKDILSAKGDTVYTISSSASLEEAVRTLVEHNVGSLVICRRDASGNDQLVGILTERDLLHCWAAGKASQRHVTVGEVMTAEVITGSPTDAVGEVMGLMTKRRIRHLPILSEGRLVGMVSIGDVVKAQHDRLAMENRFMKDYIRS